MEVSGKLNVLAALSLRNYLSAAIHLEADTLQSRSKRLGEETNFSRAGNWTRDFQHSVAVRTENIVKDTTRR
jgi:hypothetical protein